MQAPKLERRLGLFQSTVLNMIDMVGIGPFVTLPIVIGFMGGMFLYAWIAECKRLWLINYHLLMNDFMKSGKF